MNRFLIVALLFLVLCRCSAGSNNPSNLASPGKKLLNADSITMVFRDTLKNEISISYNTELGDEVYFGIPSGIKQITLYCGRLSFATITNKKQKIQLPLFGGDTIFIETGISKKYSYLSRKVTFLDTSFFRYSQVQNRLYFDSLITLNQKTLGNKIGTGNLVTIKENIPESLLSSLFLLDKQISDIQFRQIDSLVSAGEMTFPFGEMYKAIIVSHFLNNTVLLCFRESGDKDPYLAVLNNHEYVNEKYLKYDPGGYRYFLKSFIMDVVLHSKYERAGHEIIFNYPQAYDSIPNFIESGYLQEFMRLLCLKEMRNSTSTAEFKGYLTRFLTGCKVNELLVYARTNFVEKPVANDKNGQLRSITGRGMTVDSLLMMNRGRYILLDFWASWCLPCRESIVKSRELIVKLDTSRIVYYYISIDSDESAWRAASAKDKLPPGINFLLTNPNESSFLRDIKLTTIPRYIVLDRTGKIIYLNAPAPETVAFKNLMNKLLAE